MSVEVSTSGGVKVKVVTTEQISRVIMTTGLVTKVVVNGSLPMPFPVPGPKGDQGEPGEQGEPGPNIITTDTETNIEGIIAGDGSNVIIIPPTFIFEVVVGIDEGTGLEGAIEIINENFENVRVRITRGSIMLPGIDPKDGGQFFTKDLVSNKILLSSGLTGGEYFKVETIPY